MNSQAGEGKRDEMANTVYLVNDEYKLNSNRPSGKLHAKAKPDKCLVRSSEKDERDCLWIYCPVREGSREEAVTTTSLFTQDVGHVKGSCKENEDNNITSPTTNTRSGRHYEQDSKTNENLKSNQHLQDDKAYGVRGKAVEAHHEEDKNTEDSSLADRYLSTCSPSSHWMQNFKLLESFKLCLQNRHFTNGCTSSELQLRAIS